MKYQAICGFFEINSSEANGNSSFDKSLVRKSDCDIINPISQSSIERFDIAPVKKEDALQEDLLQTEDFFTNKSEVQCEPHEFLHGFMSVKFNIDPKPKC